MSELCIAHLELECNYSIVWGMLLEKTNYSNAIISAQRLQRSEFKVEPNFKPHPPAWVNETIGKQW